MNEKPTGHPSEGCKQRVIVQGLLFDNDRVLLAKRASTKKIAPGKYHIAGGHVEFGEHPDEAIIREYKEEFSIDIVPLRVIRAFSYLTNGNHEIGIVYLISLKKSSLIDNISFDSNDNEEIVWASKDNLLKYLPESDNDYITLTKYYKPI